MLVHQLYSFFFFHFIFPLFRLSPPYMFLPTLLKMHDPFIHQLLLNIYMLYILKHNLHSLYDVTCMYVSRAEHLALASRLVCASLGKTTSPTSTFHQPPTVFHRVEVSAAFPLLMFAFFTSIIFVPYHLNAQNYRSFYGVSDPQHQLFIIYPP